MDPAAPPPDRRGPDPDATRCASCGEPVRPQDSRACAVCGRRACLRCLRPYGHYMQACEECRLEAW